MTADLLISRVTVGAITALAAIAALAGWAAGGPGIAGAVGAGVIALVNFRWLALGAARVTATGGPRLAALGLGLRHLASFGALVLLLASGWAHPIAALAGLSVLPPILIVHGLAAARG
jgi:hypothetical protein